MLSSNIVHHTTKTPCLLSSCVLSLSVSSLPACCWLPCPCCALPTACLQKTENTSDETPVSYNKAVRRAAPAVVNIYNRNLNGAANVLSLGSGVIMNERGYIITNRHVIKDAQQITVVLQDGRRYEALLVGSDGLTDLAVLKIDPGNLPVIPTNKNRVAHVGDVVLAIGNPYNPGRPSLRASSAPPGASV